MVMLQKIRSFSTGGWIKCVWCAMNGEDRPGYEMHKTVFHEHARDIACDDPRAQHVNFVFCSERCRQYYLHSHISMGDLPAGYGNVS